MLNMTPRDTLLVAILLFMSLACPALVQAYEDEPVPTLPIAARTQPPSPYPRKSPPRFEPSEFNQLPKKTIQDYDIRQDGSNGAVSREVCSENGECSATTMMPVGAAYQTNFYFPLIGDWVVQMHIIGTSKARLIVEGAYPIVETLEFVLKPVKDDDAPTKNVMFDVTLSPSLQAILDSFMVTLSEISYDVEADAPSAMVAILHMLTFPIKLERQAS